ncbi:MAG: NADP-dependent isocitrate dehydrogenase [Bryobacterales bacterium]|nr:NADP-dependent isocitrate dehydrogenase [Bryobacterales bacterium]
MTEKPYRTQVAVAYGDGIGPEIMGAVLDILRSAGADLDVTPVEIGESVYRRGVTSGIEPSAWQAMRRAGVFLKAPVTTPQGGGYKSVNVTIRKTLGLFANVRPAVAYHPFVRTMHPGMDVVVIRENEEDLYAGIEHRQTDQVYQCLKLITRPGCERIVRYAFDYARAHGRKKVTCFSKDNIMKFTDGLFHKVFDEIGAEYPDLERGHMIVDIGAARLAARPGDFDVVVTPNLYGDIVSDIAAEVAGSVGLAGSANIGETLAMFEAIHGSAPDIAGRDIANPSGLLLGAVMMLVHMGQAQAASLVHNALLRTLEDGVHTPDIAAGGRGVGTGKFAEAVMARLGRQPRTLKPVSYDSPDRPAQAGVPRQRKAVKTIVGVDVFLHWSDGDVSQLASRLQQAQTETLALSMITNRGVKVWPNGYPETFCTDHWRCRFLAAKEIPHEEILRLLLRLSSAKLDFIKIENLCTFDGEPGFSLGQGQ